MKEERAISKVVQLEADRQGLGLSLQATLRLRTPVVQPRAGLQGEALPGARAQCGVCLWVVDLDACCNSA